MATLNLGRIKPVFQGAYNGSTAYVVDDIVTFGDETFICIQASTGNATSNASYWTKMAAKGTDGTDVGTTLTTQGDILYRDGSGLQRLGAGTSGQVLQTGGSGANPSWTTLSSDYVKLASVDSSGVTEVNFDNYFSSDYYHYEWVGNVLVNNNDYRVDFNPRVSGTNILANCYQGANYGYEQNNDSNASMSFDGRHNQTEGGRLSWGRPDTPIIFKVMLTDPQNSSIYKIFKMEVASQDTNYIYRRSGIATWRNNTNAYTGLRFFSPNSANMTWKITMFGFRK